MPNISDWPNDAVVSSLSQVLVRGSIPQEYFLSSKACAGILRRAEKRGKALPTPLLRALQAAVAVSKGRAIHEDKTRSSPVDDRSQVAMMGFDQEGNPVLGWIEEDWHQLLD